MKQKQPNIFKIASKYINGDITYQEFEKAMRNWINDSKEENKLTLKPFDLEAAKAGKPVCTRDGRKARIISCSLRNKNFPIAAIVEDEEENVYQFEANGVCDEHDENLDLMMLPEKKTGWINIKKDGGIFKSREEAERNCSDDYFVVEVEWEE